jgi:hypothetical protein
MVLGRVIYVVVRRVTLTMTPTLKGIKVATFSFPIDTVAELCLSYRRRFYHDVLKLRNQLPSQMTPNIAKIVQFIFPWMDGLLGAKMTIEPGFWFVALAVLLEKAVARLVMESAVTALSERQLALKLGKGGDEGEEDEEAEAAALFFSPAMRCTFLTSNLSFVFKCRVVLYCVV